MGQSAGRQALQSGRKDTVGKIQQTAQPGVKTAVVKFLRIVCPVQMCISDDHVDFLLIKNHRQQHRASSIYRQIRPIEKSTVYKAMLRNQVNQRLP